MKKLLLALFLGVFTAQLDSLNAEDDVRVREVIFRGPENQPLKGVSPFFLEKQISTKEGSVFDEAKINRDIKRLYDRGLFLSVNGIVEEADAGGKKIIFEIEVAQRVNYVVFTGLLITDRADLISEIHDYGLEDFPEERHDYYGRYLTYGHKMEIREAVLHALKQNDLVDATVTLETVKNGLDIAVIVHVDEKLPVFVNEFTIGRQLF